MIKGILFIAFLVAFIPIGHVSSYAAQSDADNKMDTASEKTADAGRAIRDYTYSQKDEFVKMSKKELKKLKRDLADLEKKADRVSGTAKVEAERQIRVAKSNVRKLNKQIDSVKDSAESTWDSVKTQFHDSMTSVKDTIDRSRKWLSAKISP